MVVGRLVRGAMLCVWSLLVRCYGIRCRASCLIQSNLVGGHHTWAMLGIEAWKSHI
jgi:hypothetical protein